MNKKRDLPFIAYMLITAGWFNLALACAYTYLTDMPYIDYAFPLTAVGLVLLGLYQIIATLHNNNNPAGKDTK